MQEVLEYLIKKYPNNTTYQTYLDGNLPKGVAIDGLYLVKNGKKKVEVKITDDVKKSAKIVKEFIEEISDKKKSEIDLTDWSSIKRRKEPKEAAILTFAQKIKIKKKLTYVQYKQLISVIHIGLFLKYIVDEDIIMEGTEIAEIRGIEFKNSMPGLSNKATL